MIESPYERDASTEPIREVVIHKGAALGPTTVLLDDMLLLQDAMRNEPISFQSGGVMGTRAWDYMAGIIGFPLCAKCDHRRPPFGDCLVCATVGDGVIIPPGLWSKWLAQTVRSEPMQLSDSEIVAPLNRQQRRAEKARKRRGTKYA